MLLPPKTTSTMCPVPLFALPHEPRASRLPEPVDCEGIGRDVEWMRVSSRSRTRVLGTRWKGVFLVANVGVPAREWEADEGGVGGVEGDGGGEESISLVVRRMVR